MMIKRNSLEVSIILTVVSVNEKMKNGSTQPFSVKCDDGNIYILKGINDHCNGKTLFNELVSYRLACLLHLPVPKCTVVELPADQVKANFEMDVLNFNGGNCFASQYIFGTPKINPMILQNISNHEDIPGIVLFDQFILNTDRSVNDGNFYYDKRSKKLMIIDHSHIFGGWQSWSEKIVLDCITDPPAIINNLSGKNYRYLRDYVAGNSPFSKIESNLSKLTQVDLDGLFDDIPLEWKVNESEISAAKKMICYQINQYKLILPQLKSVFTKWKGAC